MAECTILQGDVMERLAELPDESVQMVCTSPPYWGLRDYKLPPSVWGGDPACRHEWGDVNRLSNRISDSGNDDGSTGRQRGETQGRSAERGQFCLQCGAWRGCLGLEPMPELYVEHIVTVFREVRRVLRKDGTLFLNLGDSYTASGGGGHKEWHANPGMSRSSRRGGVPHAAPCGTADKAPEDSQDCGCLCGSLCDVCRVAYRIGRSHSAQPTSPTPTPSPSAPTRERMGSRNVHLPTSGFSLSEVRNGDAMQDLALSANHVPGQPLALPESRLGESDRPPQGMSSEASNRGDVCLLCGRSLLDLTLECADKSGGTSRRQLHMEDISSPCVERLPHTQDTCGYCSQLSPYLHYTTASLKPKDLVGIPWRVAFALQADGWYLRSDIIWAKPNPMPESVRDRPTKSHEYVFLLSKSQRYYFDQEAVREPLAPASFERARYPRVGHAKDVYGDGMTNLRNPKTDEDSRKRELQTGSRNIRSVWTIPTQPFPEAHFAVFPEALVEPCIKAGSKEGDTVLDPFGGAGTTAVVALRLARNAILIELSPEYCEMAERRIRDQAPLLNSCLLDCRQEARCSRSVGGGE